MTTMTAQSAEAQDLFSVDPLCMPKDFPREFCEIEKFDEPIFDAAIHLQIEYPTMIRNTLFQDKDFPYQGDGESHFAYTPRSFRFLSDKGLKVLKDIANHYVSKGFLKTNARSSCMRGLSYVSKFVRDLTYDISTRSLLSELAGEPIGPQSMCMNHGHINVGAVGKGKAVDEWHVDSVDYVLVLILSDTSDMIGGELQVLEMEDVANDPEAMSRIQSEGVPEDKVTRISPPPAGHCVFLKGSQLLHAVTAVESAKEARQSLIMPWSSLNVFSKDLTKYQTFRDIFCDPPNVTNLEYARHKAWRVHGQMEYLMNQVKFGTPLDEIVHLLDRAAEELQHCHNVLLDVESDSAGFVKTSSSSESDHSEMTESTVDLSWVDTLEKETPI